MTLEIFLKQCEESFGGKEYTLGQKSALIEKCSRFNERELNRIYSDLLETCKYLPRIADIYDSARSMGMIQEELRPPHRWQPTDCALCRGEGRLRIIWHFKIEERPTGLMEIRELVQIFPYTKGFDYVMKPNEYPSVYRCKCSSGDAETLPTSWPKWTNSSEPRREQWL